MPVRGKILEKKIKDQEKMKKVLVAGATGYLGSFVVKEFKQRGFYVRALSRSKDKLKGLLDHIDEVHIGQITEPLQLKNICRDIDIVFSSIGITRQRDKLSYMDVDLRGNMNLLDQAKKEGVSKFIYISVLNIKKLGPLKIAEAKLAFAEKLQKSGLGFTIIYPSGFFSDMLEILKMAKSGRAYLFGDGENRGNPIHGADLAEICVDAVDLKNKEIKIGGPDILTYNKIIEFAFQACGKSVKMSYLPLWIRNMALQVLRRFTSQDIYGPLEFFLTVSTMDMVGKQYGKHKLKDFFIENVGRK